MIWPFLLVYVSERLDAPLTAIASLLTLNSAMGLLSSFLGGPVIDRLGRKWIMVASLAMNGAAYMFMGQAHTLSQFAILMAITGAVNPLYRVGADAMMADLLPPEKRIDGYALMRLSNNLGISIGPAIGGFIAAASYFLAFYVAALGMSLYSLLLAIFARETLPSRQPGYLPQPKDAKAKQDEIRGLQYHSEGFAIYQLYFDLYFGIHMCRFNLDSIAGLCDTNLQCPQTVIWFYSSHERHHGSNPAITCYASYQAVPDAPGRSRRRFLLCDSCGWYCFDEWLCRILDLHGHHDNRGTDHCAYFQHLCRQSRPC